MGFRSTDIHNPDKSTLILINAFEEDWIVTKTYSCSPKFIIKENKNFILYNNEGFIVKRTVTLIKDKINNIYYKVYRRYNRKQLKKYKII